MNATARDHYLTTEAMTAPPQKVQLMLIEGAIRLGQQTRDYWRENRNEDAWESLTRCRRIVTEIMGNVKPEVADLARNVRSIYAYLFRLLTEANHEKSDQKLADALRILEIERDTWQAVCEKLGTASPVATSAPGAIQAESPVEGLSLQA